MSSTDSATEVFSFSPILAHQACRIVYLQDVSLKPTLLSIKYMPTVPRLHSQSVCSLCSAPHYHHGEEGDFQTGTSGVLDFGVYQAEFKQRGNQYCFI